MASLWRNMGGAGENLSAENLSTDDLEIRLRSLLASEYDKVESRTPSGRDEQTIMFEPFGCTAYPLTGCMVNIGKLRLPDPQIEKHRPTRKIEKLFQADAQVIDCPLDCRSQGLHGYGIVPFSHCRRAIKAAVDGRNAGRIPASTQIIGAGGGLSPNMCRHTNPSQV